MGEPTTADHDSWASILSSRGCAVESVAPAKSDVAKPMEPVGANRATLEEIDIVGFIKAARAAGQPLTLLANDPHRVTDTPSFLQALFGLMDESIELAEQPNIRMVISQGSHCAKADEIAAFEAKLLGENLRPRISEIKWHTAYDEGLVKVGTNSFHPWMGEGGFYVACGSLECVPYQPFAAVTTLLLSRLQPSQMKGPLLLCALTMVCARSHQATLLRGSDGRAQNAHRWRVVL